MTKVSDLKPGTMDIKLLRRGVPPFNLFYRVVGRRLNGSVYTREVHDGESLAAAKAEVLRAIGAEGA